MKLSSYFVLFATIGLATMAQATVAAPSVTGTVQQVGHSTITVNGHTYQVTADTKSDPAVGVPQIGQQLKLFLSSNGSTVTVITRASAATTAP